MDGETKEFISKSEVFVTISSGLRKQVHSCKLNISECGLAIKMDISYQKIKDILDARGGGRN
jgi:hypothetical protein